MRSRHALPRLLLLTPALLLAQSSGASYTLRKQVIASGGVRAAAGSYVLTSTIGQALAAVAQGGSYRLTGGFHQPVSSAPSPNLFANGYE